ncbi:hypothetical protein B7982_14640 [Fibrobacter sp. UWB2]|uniref:AAA family ATPase n=1 Tax=Fibrobacter sp. UWB2 TaxID=1964358 RepID=UPI000B528AA0|nr:AAA family ATPase [Fibrobacter sp. UWB2]OWV18977.1 hypothetical protein B7982_14640 [Fibrobacter sp. UWB2]
MKILIVKFRTNDLDPSYGKQVEFSSKNVQEFFEFDKTEEYITFIYNDYNFKPSLDKKSIKGYLKLSPARGDYKVYQNLDGSLFIKDFFIHELGLSLVANKDDFFILAKISSKEYFLSYIPNSSDLGKFISKNNLSGRVVDVQREELDKSVDKGLDAKAQLSNLTLQRIVFGAPGTGKSHTLEDDRKNSDFAGFERVTFHPNYSFAQFVGSYKPMVKSTDLSFDLDAEKKHVLEILNDESKSGQEKYDLLYEQFKNDTGLTRLPLLIGLYSNDDFKTRKTDGTPAVGDNSVERNHGRFIRPYVSLYRNHVKDEEITYKYVPGPFMRMYVSAKKDENHNYLLLIEEINRANVAAVFGDVFQLLDRKNGVSEYPIAASEDIKKYLKDNGIDDCEELRIPNNMYIWATMNSADQGVFPMDTAFKRRWEFEYIGIDENEDGIKDYDVPLQKKEDGSHEWVKWNDLRHSINDKLTEMKINEDKLLGPYFISEEKLKLVKGEKEDNADEFVKSFKSKVLMYLLEDAVKMRPGDLFDENAVGRLRFSDICKKFDEIGQGIFNFKK